MRLTTTQGRRRGMHVRSAGRRQCGRRGEVGRAMVAKEKGEEESREGGVSACEADLARQVR